MGWQDAPVVEEEESTPAWMSAPVVEESDTIEEAPPQKAAAQPQAESIGQSRDYSPAVERLTSLPASRAATDEMARRVVPEDWDRVLDAVHQAASQKKTVSSLGTMGRAGAAVMGAFADIGATVKRWTGDELTDEQAKFSRRLIAAQSGADPLHNPEASWYDPREWVVGAAGMYPQLQLAGVVGKGVGVAAKGVGVGAKAAGLAAGTGAAATFAPEMYENTYDRLLEKGVAPSTARWAAGTSATIQSALFAGLTKALMPKFGKPEALTGELAESIAKQYAKTVLIHGPGVVAGSAAVDAAIQDVAEGKTPEVGRILKDAGATYLKSIGPMAILAAPSALAQRIGRRMEAGGEGPSRAEGEKLGIPPGLNKSERRAWLEENRPAESQTPKEGKADVPEQVEEAGAPDGGRIPRPEVRQEGGRPGESSEGVQPSGLRERDVERQTAPPEEVVGQPTDRPSPGRVEPLGKLAPDVTVDELNWIATAESPFSREWLLKVEGGLKSGNPFPHEEPNMTREQFDKLPIEEQKLIREAERLNTAGIRDILKKIRARRESVDVQSKTTFATREGEGEGITRDVVVGGKKQGETVTYAGNEQDRQTVERVFPGRLGNASLRRFQGIALDESVRGKGVGQKMFLDAMGQDPQAWFYNSQLEPPATRALAALRKKGLVEVIYRSGGNVWTDTPEGNLGSWMARLTEKGRAEMRAGRVEKPLLSREFRAQLDPNFRPLGELLRDAKREGWTKAQLFQAIDQMGNPAELTRNYNPLLKEARSYFGKRLSREQGKLEGDAFRKVLDSGKWWEDQATSHVHDYWLNPDRIKEEVAKLAGLGDPPKTPPPERPPPPGVKSPAGGPDPVSIQNAYTEKRLRELGKPPHEPVEEIGWAQSEAEANAVKSADVTAFVDDLRANPRAVENQTAQFMLLRRTNELEVAHTKAKASGDKAAIDRAEADLADIYSINKKTGSIEGAVFNLRKAAKWNDGSITALTRRMIEANGYKPLDPKQRADVDRHSKDIQEREAAVAAREAELEASAKRQDTAERRVRKQFGIAAENGLNPDELRTLAEEKATVENKATKEYNAAYRTVVKATGLTPKVVADLENRPLLEPTGADRKTTTDITEYHGLDRKAGQLAREHPELGLRYEAGDAQQRHDNAQAIVDLVKRGPKPEVTWGDRLEDAARDLVAERFVKPPEGAGDAWESPLDAGRGGELNPWDVPGPGKEKAAGGKKAIERKSPERLAAEKAASDAVARYVKTFKGGLKEETGAVGEVHPERMKAAVDVIRAYVKLGKVRFGDFWRSVKNAFGEGEQPVFRAAWNQMQKAGEIPVEEKKPLTVGQRTANKERALDKAIAQLESDLKANRIGRKTLRPRLTSPEIEAKEERLAELRTEREERRKQDPAYQAGEEARRTATAKRSILKGTADLEARTAEMERTGEIPPKKQIRKITEDKELTDLKHAREQAWDRFRATKEGTALKNRTLAGKAVGAVADVSDLAQAIMTGYEFSQVLRQGVFYTLGFPNKALPSIVKSVKAFFSKRAEFAIREDLRNKENAAEGRGAGLETTSPEGTVAQGEEGARGRLLKFVPGLKASSRAFSTFTNQMRQDLYDYEKASISAGRTWTEQDAKDVAKDSNIFSGRPKIGRGDGVLLSRAFFAPRWVWSRVLLKVGEPLWRGDYHHRKAVAKVYVRWALGMAAYYGIKQALYTATAEDEEHKPVLSLHPLSSDFGKQRMGDTRTDTTSGLGQLVTLVARLATGEKETQKGEVVPIRGEEVKYGQDKADSLIGAFLRRKLAPLPSAVMDYLSGENAVGQPVTPAKIVQERFTPMTWSDIIEAEQELGVKQGTVAAALAFFGDTLQTHKKQPKAKKKISKVTY